jgi:GYF domain 2
MPFRIPTQDQDFSLPVEPVVLATSSSAVSSAVREDNRANAGGQETNDLVRDELAKAADAEESVLEESKPESIIPPQLVAPPMTPGKYPESSSSNQSARSTQSTVTSSNTSPKKSSNSASNVRADKKGASDSVGRDESKSTKDSKAQSLPPIGTSADTRLPEAIRVAPEAMWFVRPPSGGQFGPASGPIFSQWVDERRVTRDSLVWREGWEQWKLADEVFLEAFPLANKAGPPEPVFNLESKSKGGEPAATGVRAPDWMIRRKQQKKRLQRQITLGLVVVAVLLTLVLIWVVFFREKDKEKKAAVISPPYERMVDSTPTTKEVFVVHSTVV